LEKRAPFVWSYRLQKYYAKIDDVYDLELISVGERQFRLKREMLSKQNVYGTYKISEF
jgi:hypothetical protein